MAKKKSKRIDVGLFHFVTGRDKKSKKKGFKNDTTVCRVKLKDGRTYSAKLKDRVWTNPVVLAGVALIGGAAIASKNLVLKH